MFNIYNILGLKFNSINKVKFNSSIKNDTVVDLPMLLSRVGPRPIALDENMYQLAILENAHDIYLDQEVKGLDELTFNIDIVDANFMYIKNENLIQMFNTIYIIREINVDKNNMKADVFCEALWYDIAYGEPLTKADWNDTNVRSIANDILYGSGWKIGTVGNFNHSSLHVQIDDNRLSALRKLESKVGGELIFDTQNKIVHLFKEVVNHTGASIMYDKNADNIQANYDTKELVTKIYPYGADGLTIKNANNGKEYLENYSYTKKVRVQVISDERYTNPYELKDMCERALEELSKPRSSYNITMKDMTEKSGLEHEKFFIGGLVRVYDKELNLDVTTRIMKWKYNVSEPEQSDMNLEYKAKSLSELLTGEDNYSNMFSSDNGKEIANLSVFNQLLNSRADDGFAYWSNSGFTIDSSKGSSGNSSFKATGQLGVEKRLKQTIYPADNSNFAISFKAQTENLVETNSSAIGVEVKIKYTDGTTETKFVKLT